MTFQTKYMYQCLKYAALLILMCGFTQKNEKKPADYVNPFIWGFIGNLALLNGKIRIN
jgi:hypothetical protein